MASIPYARATAGRWTNAIPACRPSGLTGKRLISSCVFASLALLCFLIGVQGSVQAQPKKAKIVITSPKAPAGTQVVATGNVIYMEYTVNDPEITFVKFRITTDVGDAGGFVAKTAANKTDYARYVPLFKGANTIELYAVKGDVSEKTPADKLGVGCNDPRCYSALPPTIPEGASSETAETVGRNVTISRPAGGEAVTDTPTIERTFSVQKASGIKKLMIDVMNGDRTIEHTLVDLEDFNETLSYKKLKLKVAAGKNVIRAYSLEKLGEKANHDAIEVTLTCTDTKCGKGAETTASSDSSTKSEVKILQPTNGFDASNDGDFVAYLSISKDSKIAKLQYEVFSDGKLRGSEAAGDIPAHPGKEATLHPKIKLWKGENTIRFFDPNDPANPESQAAIKVKCENDTKCLKPGEKATEEVASKITIDEPKIPEGKKAVTAENQSSIDSYVTVAKGSGIAKIQYDVMSGGKVVFTSEPQLVGDTSAKAIKLPVRLKFLKGLNTIRIYDADEPGGDKDASISIECIGENCATDLDIATIATNSRFTRAILGIEQAGASSADSESSPFLDFFFTTPLKFSEGEVLTNPDGTQMMENGKPKRAPRVPTFGAWAQARFSSTPQQTSAFAVFPSNFVNQATDPTKVVDLVQSFDFLAGIEYRAFNADGWILTLIPGVKQRTSLYFTFGGGAISPLAARKESAQIFKVPPAAIPAMDGKPEVPAHPQRAEFLRRFGDPKANTYVGFVPLERDRFFRQYYVGLRLKTHYCEDDACRLFRNRFPSIVDIAFGQNEAVTGGRLTAQITDPITGVTKRRRAWVGRVDAFFPLPFREANFLYLYGTVLMKLGGAPVNITTPLFLDEAGGEVHIFDANVYIPPANLQPTRHDRDYYKIGIGVNLTDLFNRNKTRPQ